MTDLEIDGCLHGTEIYGILAAKELLSAISKSGLPEDMKFELSDITRKVWVGLKVNLEDIILLVLYFSDGYDL